MRMAYLILAHDEREQLEALVDRLVPEGSPDVVIVHADRRSALWRDLRNRWPEDTPNRGLVRDPIAVRWGHWSQVAAIARLVRAAHREGCDYVHLVSGADWPLVTREHMVRAIAAETSRPCYIESVPAVLEQRMQCRRLDTRWLRLDPARDRFRYAACWELRRLSGWLDAALGGLGLERSRPYGPWRRGWTWWSLPREAIAVLAEELPELIASGRLLGTVCSDEHVVPTIIARHFPGRIADYRRFILWPDGESSPRLLGRADNAAMQASGAWFARKVSLRHDPFFMALDRDETLVPA